MARAAAIATVTALTSGVAPASALAADDCPNAEVRAKQGMTHAPDCRGLEMVTPVDKQGAEVDSLARTQVAPGGDRIAFSTANPFSGSASASAYNISRSTRSASGWDTHPLDLPQTNGFIQLVGTTRWFSSDLDRYLSASRYALAPGAVDGESNVYLVGADGEPSLMAHGSSTELSFAGLYYDFVGDSQPIIGASENLEHVLFSSTELLTPDATGSNKKAYLWSEGDLRLIGRLPNGTIGRFQDRAGSATHTRIRNPVSEDGSKVFFTLGTSSTQGALYMWDRETASTKLISYSQRSGGDPTLARSAYFEGATPDGNYVFFASSFPLTDDPTLFQAQSSTGAWLYRYATATDDLVLVSQVPDPPVRADAALLWISEDGSRAYFTSQASLDPDRPGPGLFVWDDGDITLAAPGVNAWQTSVAPLEFSATSSGRWLTFLTAALLDPRQAEPSCPAIPSANVPAGRCAEIFAYDTQADSLSCVSCPPEGTSAGHAASGLPTKYAGQPARVSNHHTRGVLDDGTVLFDTPTGLVPGDANGKRDVYQWRGGEPKLLTTGTSTRDATYSGVSRDGGDVFVLTDGALVAQDGDDNRDLYSVRRDGGIPAQNVLLDARGCAPEACQGPTPRGPGAPRPGSADLAGSGNAAPKRVAVRPSLRLPRTARGARAVLRVRVPAAGRIRITGPGLLQVTRRVGTAGVYRVPVRLADGARRALTNRGRLRVSIGMRFTPTAGVPRTVRGTLRFAKARKEAR